MLSTIGMHAYLNWQVLNLMIFTHLNLPNKKSCPEAVSHYMWPSMTKPTILLCIVKAWVHLNWSEVTYQSWRLHAASYELLTWNIVTTHNNN